MNATETAAALALMHVAWPSATITENTAPVWAEMLVGVDPQDGLDAAKSLMRSSKWFPSIAEYTEATRSACRIRTGNSEGVTPENRKALPEGEPIAGNPAENVAKLLANMRGLLAARANQVHWHGGPTPCRVCGGMTTDPKVLARHANGPPLRLVPAPAAVVPSIDVPRPMSYDETYKADS